MAEGDRANVCYSRLCERFREVAIVAEVEAMLHWDQLVTMPTGGAWARGEQLAVLASMRIERLQASEVGEWLDGACAQPPEDPWERANLREMRRLWRHEQALSPSLAAAWARARTRCEALWRAENSRDSEVMPAFCETVRLLREIAAAKAELLGCSAYDALLDQYEPGGRAERIQGLFDEIEGVLPAMIDDARSRQARWPASEEERTQPCPRELQHKLARSLMKRLGFDFTHGRLDASAHPFCGGVPGDIRVTTWYREHDLRGTLMAVLHETGHALYEAGLPGEWRYQPVGAARGMALHESQSLFVEMQAARSRPFQEFLARAVGEVLELAHPVHAQAWYRATVFVSNTAPSASMPTS